MEATLLVDVGSLKKGMVVLVEVEPAVLEFGEGILISKDGIFEIVSLDVLEVNPETIVGVTEPCSIS